MADHDREQAHIMSASTAFADVQARNTEIRRSYTLFMEVYEPTLNRVKKSTHKPLAALCILAKNDEDQRGEPIGRRLVRGEDCRLQ
jgi:hypothetical protein